MPTYLHFAWNGDVVLFHNLKVVSLPSFLLASCLCVLVSFSERLVELALKRQWTPIASVRRSKVQYALWRTLLYWITMFMRLMLMIIAMSGNLGIIFVIAGSQAILYFLAEISSNSDGHDPIMPYTLMGRDSCDLQTAPVSTRSRAKSRPDHIFIHPTESNLARADAAAQELGLSGDTELVKGTQLEADEQEWQTGKGPGVARALMGNSRRHSESQQFSIGDDDELDSSSLLAGAR